MDPIVKCLKAYASFRGRAGVVELWSFLLFVFLIQALGFGIDRLMGWEIATAIPWISLYPSAEIARVLLLLPSLAVTSRRLHDVDESGWLSLLWFLPIIGWIILVPKLCRRGGLDANEHGPPIMEQDSTATRNL